MKELDFDIFLSNDAGRSFYRGLVIYGSFYAFIKSKSISSSQGRQNAIKTI